MVEMVEVASILKGATNRSLVILDEVGRGTATFDGLSLAWAVVEYLIHQNDCRGLFATHYHELTALANRLDGITLHTMRIKEWKGDIVFLHEVGEGAIDRSYGIHVAKLAGLPDVVLSRATQVLEQLEEKKQEQKPLFDDLPLFSAAMATTYHSKPSEVEETLRKIDVDLLSPREALDFVYQLKKMTEKK
jgi:DNA mismatch repair protein MutS